MKSDNFGGILLLKGWIICVRKLPKTDFRVSQNLILRIICLAKPFRRLKNTLLHCIICKKISFSFLFIFYIFICFSQQSQNIYAHAETIFCSCNSQGKCSVVKLYIAVNWLSPSCDNQLGQHKYNSLFVGSRAPVFKWNNANNIFF